MKVTPHGEHKIAGIQYVSGYITAPVPFYRFYDVAVVITQTPRTTGKLGFAWSPQGFAGVMNHAGYPGETPPFDSTGFRRTVFRCVHWCGCAEH
jgi:hypothetical protein